MTSIFDGIRAGVIAAVVLVVWSTIAVSGQLGDGGAGAMAYVGAAAGLIGLPVIVWGGVIGGGVAVGRRVLEDLGLSPLREALTEPETDRRVAAGLVAFLTAPAVVAAGVASTHLYVTAGFARASFQAAGLAMAAAGFSVVAAFVVPVAYRLIRRGFEKLPLGDERPMWTWMVLGVGGLGALAAIVFGYGYASELRVWTATELRMGVAAVVAPVLLTAAMHFWRKEATAWKYGVPAVGLAVCGVCFVAASSWTMASPEMRQLTYRDAPLLSMSANTFAAVDVDHSEIWADADGCDGDDCEDDELLSVTSPQHPARTAVQSAVRSGDRAQQNEFEAIPDPPKNVVFVMIDTLRQDHMGYAGYERDTTPNIDRIAADDAVVFNDAYATSPHTPRTIPPIFFGRYASNLNWILPNANFPRLTEHNTSMYEVKRDAGWETIGKMSHFYFRERRGVHQGFEVWDNDDHRDLEDSHDDIATPRIWEKLEPTIRRLGEQHREDGEEADPFSIFVHFFDPHARYNRHDEFPFDRGDTNRERLMADYDSEIAHADSYVGRIIEALKEEELYDDTIFVLTSDHGEAFNEHGYYFHGQTLYNTVLNVPLLIRVPGWFTREVDGPVSVIDLGPTLLELLGLRIPSEYDGEALTDVLLGRSEVPERPVFAELLPYTAFDEHHRAVIYGDEKLIVDFTLDVEEFYDLSDDPMEQNNIRDERPERAAYLREMLDEFME